MPLKLLPYLLLLVGLVLPWGGRVRAEESSGDAVTSVDALRDAWTASPESVAAGVAFQDALVETGEEGEARRIFRKAQMRNRKSAALGFLYGRILGGRDGRRRMREALDDDAQLGGASVPGLRVAWRSLRDAERAGGDLDAAAAAAQRVLRLEPEAWDWAAAGSIQERTGDAQGAIASYGQALDLRADYLWVRNALALLLARRGESEKAVEIAQKTVEMLPEDGSAQLHLGLVLCLAGKTEAGREAYAAALRCAGEDADSLAAVAVAYTDLEDYALANKALVRALRIEPDHERALISSGVLALELGKPETALRHLDRAAKLRPKDAHVAFLRGLCHERLGHDKRAVKGYRKAMSLRGDSVLYLTALARALGKQGAIASAISILRKAMKVDPAAADLQLQLGFFLIQKKRWAEALRAMERAAELDDTDARPWFYIAILYGDHLRREQDALRALRLYKELGGREPSALRWLKELEDD